MHALRRLLLPSLLVAFFAWGPSFVSHAVAQDDPFDALSDDEVERLLTLLDVADQAAEQERWAEALAAYRDFLSVIPDDRVRIEVPACLAALGRYAEAMTAYEELADSTDDADVRAQALEGANEIRTSHPATLRVETSPPNALIRVAPADGGESQPLLPGVDAIYTAGAYLVEVTADGYVTEVFRIRLEPDGSLTRQIALRRGASLNDTPADVLPSSPDDRGRRLSAAVPVALGAASVASFATAGGFAAKRGNLLRRHDGLDESDERRDGLATRGTRATRSANAFAAIGAGLAVGAVVTGIVRAKQRPSDSESSFSIMPVLGAVSGVSLRF